MVCVRAWIRRWFLVGWTTVPLPVCCAWQQWQGRCTLLPSPHSSLAIARCGAAFELLHMLHTHCLFCFFSSLKVDSIDFLVLERGYDVNASDIDTGRTPLMEAAKVCWRVCV